MNSNDNRRQIQSINRTCEILRYLGESGPTNLATLAEYMDLAPGTLHPYLVTLSKNGLVGREGKKYRLGLAIRPLSELMKQQIPLYQAGHEEAEMLAKKHDAMVHLIAPFDNQLIVLYEMYGERANGQEVYTNVRNRLKHFHCTGAGKVVLAHLPRSCVTDILDQQGMPAYTKNTITDRDELFDELDLIREQGFALNREEFMKGNRGTTAPIFGESDEVIGTISVSGPANQLTGNRFREELPESIMRSASMIEMNLHSSIGEN